MSAVWMSHWKTWKINQLMKCDCWSYTVGYMNLCLHAWCFLHHVCKQIKKHYCWLFSEKHQSLYSFDCRAEEKRWWWKHFFHTTHPNHISSMWNTSWESIRKRRLLLLKAHPMQSTHLTLYVRFTMCVGVAGSVKASVCFTWQACQIV